MEDIRTYRIEEDETRRGNDQSSDRDRSEYSAAPEDEVPFHIPRD